MVNRLRALLPITWDLTVRVSSPENFYSRGKQEKRQPGQSMGAEGQRGSGCRSLIDGDNRESARMGRRWLKENFFCFYL